MNQNAQKTNPKRSITCKRSATPPPPSRSLHRVLTSKTPVALLIAEIVKARSKWHRWSTLASLMPRTAARDAIGATNTMYVPIMDPYEVATILFAVFDVDPLAGAALENLVDRIARNLDDIRANGLDNLNLAASEHSSKHAQIAPLDFVKRYIRECVDARNTALRSVMERRIAQIATNPNDPNVTDSERVAWNRFVSELGRGTACSVSIVDVPTTLLGSFDWERVAIMAGGTDDPNIESTVIAYERGTTQIRRLPAASCNNKYVEFMRTIVCAAKEAYARNNPAAQAPADASTVAKYIENALCSLNTTNETSVVNCAFARYSREATSPGADPAAPIQAIRIDVGPQTAAVPTAKVSERFAAYQPAPETANGHCESASTSIESTRAWRHAHEDSDGPTDLSTLSAQKPLVAQVPIVMPVPDGAVVDGLCVQPMVAISTERCHLYDDDDDDDEELSPQTDMVNRFLSNAGARSVFEDDDLDDCEFDEAAYDRAAPHSKKPRMFG